MGDLTESLPKQVFTERLILELFDHSPAHYECLLQCVNNKTAYEMMGDFGLYTPADFDSLLRAVPLSPDVCQGKTSKEAIYYLLRTKDEPESLIGGISMAQRGKDVPPDIGWCVIEAYMGKGYAVEAGLEILKLFQEEVGVREIIAWPGETNSRSIRVAEKIGLVRGDTIYDKDGSPQVVYVLPGMKLDRNTVLDLWGDNAR